jgi:acyl-CoA synthetase (AMP-forming)/AMP-acid ligase II
VGRWVAKVAFIAPRSQEWTHPAWFAATSDAGAVTAMFNGQQTAAHMVWMRAQCAACVVGVLTCHVP